MFWVSFWAQRPCALNNIFMAFHNFLKPNAGICRNGLRLPRLDQLAGYTKTMDHRRARWKSLRTSLNLPLIEHEIALVCTVRAEGYRSLLKFMFSVTSVGQKRTESKYIQGSNEFSFLLVRIICMK
jgi:hypothetical protein